MTLTNFVSLTQACNAAKLASYYLQAHAWIDGYYGKDNSHTIGREKSLYDEWWLKGAIFKDQEKNYI